MLLALTALRGDAMNSDSMLKGLQQRRVPKPRASSSAITPTGRSKFVPTRQHTINRKSQSKLRALAERKLPDKSHNLSSHAVRNRKATDHRVLCCNWWQRDHAIQRNDDGDSTVSPGVAPRTSCSNTHQQRYAATAHSTEAEAAKESAAM